MGTRGAALVAVATQPSPFTTGLLVFGAVLFLFGFGMAIRVTGRRRRERTASWSQELATSERPILEPASLGERAEGWYGDPWGGPCQRRWDGTAWTEELREYRPGGA